MHDETLLKAARAACEAQSLRELADVAVGHVKQSLDAANVLLFSFGPHGLRGEAGALAPALDGYTPELFGADVIQQAVLRAKCVATPTVPTQWRSLDLHAHKRSAAYAEFYRPFDIEHIICVHLNDIPYGSDGMRGVLFCRSERQQPFRQTDVERVASVAPFLRAARGRIELFERTQDRLRALEALVPLLSQKSALLLDANGGALWVSASAQRLLEQRGAKTRPPEELARAARELVALARGQTAQPSAHLVRLAGSGSQALHARIDLLLLDNGQPTVLAQVFTPDTPLEPESPPNASLEPAQSTTQARPPSPVASAAPLPPSTPAMRRAIASLTPAEREVLTLLRHGLNNRTIAQRRSVSLETVRTHVRRILSKLGVENRSQAALIAQALSEL